MVEPDKFYYDRRLGKTYLYNRFQELKILKELSLRVKIHKGVWSHTLGGACRCRWCGTCALR